MDASVRSLSVMRQEATVRPWKSHVSGIALSESFASMAQLVEGGEGVVRLVRLVGERVEEGRVVAHAAARIVDAGDVAGAVLEGDQLGGDAGRLEGGAEVLVLHVGEPLVEDALALVGGEAVLVEMLVREAHLAHRLRGGGVGVVGEEVERPLVVAGRREELVGALHEVFRARRGVGGGDVVRADARVEAAVSVAADLEVGELRLQVGGDGAVELHVLGEGAAEHRVEVVVGMVLGLVPDFPVGDLHLEAVGPALGVVPDHVLADASPLRVVLGRQDVHGRVAP